MRRLLVLTFAFTFAFGAVSAIVFTRAHLASPEPVPAPQQTPAPSDDKSAAKE